MSVFDAHERLVEITRTIEDGWRRTDNQVKAFPEIVTRAVGDQDFSVFGHLTEASRLLEDPYVASLQEPSTFSDLYLKIFDNGRFYVELLNWWGSDINIHDHDFSGVQFQLAGTSLNVDYRFDEERWSPKLTLGEIKVRGAQIWQEGDHSFVYPGPESAHTVSHLSFPTVSMLIRTHGAAEFGPQRNYFPPFVAGDYGVADIVFRKRIGLLRLLARSDDAQFDDAFRRIVAVHTPTENLFAMMKLFDILFSEPRAHLVREFVSAGGSEAEAVVHSCAYHRASDFILNIVKRIGGLDDTDVLTASVLGSSFDAVSYAKISNDIELCGFQPDLARLIETVDRVRPDESARLRDILRLFDLIDLVPLLSSPPPSSLADLSPEERGSR
jgi:hypothetical protein